MKKMFKLFVSVSVLLLMFACSEREPVGFTGPYEVVNGDTVRFTIPQFEFYNQDSITTTNKDLAGKFYVMSFFFSSCPGTCPIITGNLTAVHQEFKDNDKVHIASISIDPNYDSYSRLREYAKGFEIDTKHWTFMRNNETYTHNFIQERLYQSVIKDPNAPGGFDHSSKILLVDDQGRLRKFYEGTDKKEIKKLIEDIKTLTEK